MDMATARGLRVRRGFSRAAAALAAVVLAAGLLGAPPRAEAAVNFGTVKVYLPGSVQVTAGGSTSVSCTIDPYSHQQTPNCTTDYCPSGCDFASGGCLNAAGQCTCFGTAYSTYYSTASASSSNPSVARATYANGVLHVDAYQAGTCTITVYGSLRLWTTGTGTMQVTVTEPVASAPSGGAAGGAASGGDAPSGGAASGGAAQDGGATYWHDGGTAAGAGSGSGSGGAVAGSVSVSDAGVTAGSSTGQVLSALVAGGNPVQVEQGAQAIEEGSVSLVRLGEGSVAEELAAVAGTKSTVCFWEGDSVEEARYMWSFAGADLAPEAVTDADLGVEDVTEERGELARALEGATYRALDFAQEGAYPCPASFAYRVSDVFDNGERLTLYFYDEDAGSLVLVQEGVEVSEGYATFRIDHGSVWVLANDDGLAGPLAEGEGAAEDGAAPAQVAPDGAEAAAEDFPVAPIAAGAAAVAVGAIAVGTARRRARRRGGRSAADARGASGRRCRRSAEGRRRGGGRCADRADDGEAEGAQEAPDAEKGEDQ